LIVGEQYQGEIEMHVVLRRVETLGSLQLRNGKGILLLLEVDQSEPVRKIGVLGPPRHRCLTDCYRLSEAAFLKIAQQQPAVCFFAVWGKLPSLLEGARREGEISSVNRTLTFAKQGWQSLILRAGDGSEYQQ
jgi:hypothetical protein